MGKEMGKGKHIRHSDWWNQRKRNSKGTIKPKCTTTVLPSTSNSYKCC